MRVAAQERCVNLGEAAFSAEGSFLHSACSTCKIRGISFSAPKWGLVIASKSPHVSKCTVVKGKYLTQEKYVIWCLVPGECSTILVIIINRFSILVEVSVNGLYDV